MELVLTGDSLGALEAEKAGLVAKIFPPEEVLPEAMKLGPVHPFVVDISD